MNSRNKFEDKDDKMLQNTNNISNININSNNSNFDKSQTTVQKLSEDWRFVEFHLKSSVIYEVDIKSVIPIYNQHMLINFEKRAKNKLFTFAWIKNINDDKNNILKLRSRGFEISNNGMDFTVGNIFDESDDDIIKETDDNYILCKIIIGRSYCKIVKDKMELDKFATENAFKNMRPDFDSIMFCPSDSAFNRPARSTSLNYINSNNSKSFRYRLFDSANILPMYMVTFNAQDVNSSNPNSYSNKRVCGECSEKDAECFCYNCEEYLCKDCYQLIHGEKTSDKSNKLIINHKKEDISKIKTGRCMFDPDKEVEFYCETCRIAICSYCRVIGSHSKGEAMFHNLKDIHLALDNENPEKLEIIKTIDDKKKKVLEALNKVKMTIEKLRYSVTIDTSKQLQQEFNEEESLIHAKSLEYMNSYLTTLNELFVIKDTITYIDKYFTDRENYLKENNNKAEFIWVWNHHSKILQEVINNKLYINQDFKNPDAKDLLNIKINEIRITPYRFEESNLKDLNKDELHKTSKDTKKQ